MKYLFVFSLFCLSSLTSAQQLVINEDPAVMRMMEKYIENNRRNDFIMGYRIVVIATANRKSMEDTRTSFQKNFSYYKTKWDYSDPYYSLRAGAFASRSDALIALENIKKIYPQAFLSSDKINYSELSF